MNPQINVNDKEDNEPTNKSELLILLCATILVLLLGISQIKYTNLNSLKTQVTNLLEKNTGIILIKPNASDIKKQKTLDDFYSLLPIKQPTFTVDFDFVNNKYNVSQINNNASYQYDFKKWLQSNGYITLDTNMFVFVNQTK